LCKFLYSAVLSTTASNSYGCSARYKSHADLETAAMLWGRHRRNSLEAAATLGNSRLARSRSLVCFDATVVAPVAATLPALRRRTAAGIRQTSFPTTILALTLLGPRTIGFWLETFAISTSARSLGAASMDSRSGWGMCRAHESASEPKATENQLGNNYHRIPPLIGSGAAASLPCQFWRRRVVSSP
jgi:hypothetical protein